MSDDRSKELEGLGDLDWDSALDDWEKNTFVPEVQRDAESNKVSPPNADESRDEPKGSTELEAGAAQGSLKDLSSEGTVIAPVPKELRADAPRVPPTPSRPPPPLVAPPPHQRASSHHGVARGGPAPQCQPDRTGWSVHPGQSIASAHRG